MNKIEIQALGYVLAEVVRSAMADIYIDFTDAREGEIEAYEMVERFSDKLIEKLREIE